jgi:hypothetical protein
MARFTTRVELHNADSDDYEDLHKYMGEKGFSRTITSENGTKYHLPSAEYNREANVTIETVLEDAKTAAGRTKRDYEILVTESAGRKWQNLKKV